MHQLIPLKAKVWGIVSLTWMISYIASIYFSEPIKISLLATIVETAIVGSLFYSWPITSKLPSPLPIWMRTDLTGRWEGTIKSGWTDKDGQKLEPIPVSFDIHQNWLKITFLATTDKMATLDSLAAHPTYDSHTGILEIRYFYRTQPNIANTKENPAQALAAAIAVIDIADPASMRIAYTNEQGPGGNIQLHRC